MIHTPLVEEEPLVKGLGLGQLRKKIAVRSGMAAQHAAVRLSSLLKERRLLYFLEAAVGATFRLSVKEKKDQKLNKISDSYHMESNAITPNNPAAEPLNRYIYRLTRQFSERPSKHGALQQLTSFRNDVL